MTDTPTTDLTAPEAVEQIAQAYDEPHITDPLHLPNLTAATLRALSAALYVMRLEVDRLQTKAAGAVDAARMAETRAEALDAKLKEAVEVLRMIESIRPMWEGGVKGTSADNLSNTLEHMRAEARTFLASLEGDKP